MKRRRGELKKVYHKRLKIERETVSQHLLGRALRFFREKTFLGTYRRNEWNGDKYIGPPPPIEKEPIISPATGKRHAGENLKAFRKRRTISNAKRRQREKERKHQLSPVGICPNCGKRRAHFAGAGDDGYYICEEKAA